MHGLCFEGSPFDAAGNRLGVGTGGVGHGMCSCGEKSPEPLSSGKARQQWHREHKAGVAIAEKSSAPASGAKSMTKAQFEAYCNEHVQVAGNDGWGGSSGPRSRPWGTWVRNADRDYFNEMYRQHLEEGKLPS